MRFQYLLLVAEVQLIIMSVAQILDTFITLLVSAHSQEIKFQYRNRLS